MKKKHLVTLLCGLTLTTFSIAAKPAAVLNADFSAKMTNVSPTLYGIFYEDINYSADGGLYGEMVQNRSFQFKFGNEKWKTIKPSKTKFRIRIKKDNPLNKNNTKYAELKIEKPGCGISNFGYNGMPFTKGKTYKGSVYLRSSDKSVKTLTIYLYADGKKIASQTIKGITDKWIKYPYSLTPDSSTEKGALCLVSDNKGTLDVDMVSLFRADIYKNEPNGLRADLAQKLEDLHPAFVRFPGGCVVQGVDMAHAYEWKNSIGPVENRKENENFWGYYQSLGIGFYEYFRLCDDIGAEPIPIINCGVAFQGNSDHIAMNKLQPYIQDALDLIEFANGDVNTTWGKKRAEMGHPKPFNMKYLGIGNENSQQMYYDRYEAFGKAIRKKYPNIKLILSAGAFPNDTTFFKAWDEAKGPLSNYVNLLDEHYYQSPEWFLTNTHRYDNYDRNGKHVFVGEYAAQVSGKKNNMFEALSEAAYMTSLERNGDIVDIASYAPLFAKVGSTQWTPDMIWFDNSKSWGSPTYYVQQMFMTNKSDKTVKYSLDIDSSEKKEPVIGGTIGLGTWSTQAQYKDIKVTDLNGKTLYTTDNMKNMSDFIQKGGVWKQNGNTIVETGNATPSFILKKTDNGWKNYVLTLKAQKTSGSEGFLISFGNQKDGSLYWWNMGGWGNTVSCVEKGTLQARSTVSKSVSMKLETNQWYDIKIEVKGDWIRCYLDGKKIHEFEDVQTYDPVFAHVGEKGNNEIIVKLVNMLDKKQDVQINLNNVKNLSSTGKALIMSASETAENSEESPKNVSPHEETVANISNNFDYSLQPDSVTILTLTTN